MLSWAHGDDERRRDWGGLAMIGLTLRYTRYALMALLCVGFRITAN